MDTQKVYSLYMSATGMTEQTANTIAGELAAKLVLPLESIHFTRPFEREKDYYFTDADIAVIGTPTYAGRMPNKLVADFGARLHGNGALAVGVVTFGNRGYDNALAELCALLEAAGFRTVAAGAFACRHAFTDQLAYGRPGWSDLNEMKRFANQIADKVKSLTDKMTPVRVPGDPDAPYYTPLGMDGQPAKFLKVKPKTDPSRCSRCGACARLCPTGAIDRKDVFSVPGTCIKCQACIRKCTRGAKFFDDPAFLSHVAMLEASFADPKENEVFL